MSNRLIYETSPYLLQHAENPVDWYPWGEEAFRKARDEDKPVFLSIGYSSCHWCHVMARESFSDQSVADRLNRSFISVKVDREERPDIDGVYMEACQAMTGSGGWPLNLFLTPDGKPFFAGTYFPKLTAYGVPGFSDLLDTVAQAWNDDRETLLASADAVTNALKTSDGPVKETNAALIPKALDALRRSFDSENGGFGPAPKFPTPHTLLFLLQQYEKHADADALRMAETTLEHMATGGLFDHIGGGFCRYSTDRRFLVPHFEKMLYDNALLILCYSKAFELTANRRYLDVAVRCAAYLMRDMRSRDGGFYCAQDADSEGEEGSYYLFTPAEILAVLGMERGAAFCACFNITERGNFEGKSIPNLLAHPRTAERFDAELRMLDAYRRQRAALKTDDKHLTYWNALTVTALCALYRVSRDEAYLAAAVSAYRFIQSRLTRDGVLYASCKDGKTGSRAFLDDHAGLALAALALYDATLDPAYLDDSAGSMQEAVNAFFDVQAGGFFFTGAEHERLLIRSKEAYDGALPCGNSVMTYVLVRLTTLVPDRVPKHILEQQLVYMRSQAASYPRGYTAFLFALSDWEDPPAHLVAVGVGEEAKRLPLQAPLGTDVILLDHETAVYPMRNGKPTYYLCKDRSCLPPTDRMPDRAAFCR